MAAGTKVFRNPRLMARLMGLRGVSAESSGVLCLSGSLGGKRCGQLSDGQDCKDPWQKCGSLGGSHSHFPHVRELILDLYWSWVGSCLALHLSVLHGFCCFLAESQRGLGWST